MVKQKTSNQRTGEEQKPSPLRERGRQWFLAFGTVFAIVASTLGFLSDSLGMWQYVKNSIFQGAEVVTPAPKYTAVALTTATATPTPPPPTATTSSATPTSASTPTSTPLPVEAAPNERLVIIAQFANFAADASYNVAGRIDEALTEQVNSAQLDETRVAEWPETVESNAEATQILKTTRAILLIWGEYDSGRVRVRFTVAGGGDEVAWQRLLSTPNELSTSINLDVPRESQALALMALGRLYRKSGELEQARSAFAQALAKTPSDPNTVATLTFYLAILDTTSLPPRLDAAITGYGKVIEMQPQWFNAHYNRGLAYLDRYWQSADATNLDSAIDDFNWTLQIKSNYTEAYINRGIAYLSRNLANDLDAAVQDFTSAMTYTPTSYRAYYNRGLAYIRLDQEASWVADLHQSLEIAPTYWEAHHALCWGYALANKPNQGLGDCEIAVSHDDSGASHDGSALVLAEMGEADEAMDALTHYLAWLDEQPEATSKLNNRALYENVLEGLRSGENRVDEALLEQLR